MFETRTKLPQLLNWFIDETDEQVDGLQRVADALAVIHIRNAIAAPLGRRTPFTSDADRPDTRTGHNHDIFQAKQAAPVSILITEPFTRDQTKVQKRRICCAAKITPAIATSSSELNCPINAKRVPRASCIAGSADAVRQPSYQAG
jgi:hypothetical protein